MNRWSFLSAGGAFEMRDQRSSVFMDMKHFDFAEKYGTHEYIVLSHGAAPVCGGFRQTKVWPKEQYEEFVKIQRTRFPKMKIIQIVTNKEPEIDGVDEILRDVEIEDVKVLLKCAVACVSSEGGVAHLAAQLSTPTVVIFGPTPEYYYGYKRNVNIVSPFCSDCMIARPNWYVACPRGFSTAKCMDAVSGEMVADAVSKILDARKKYRYIFMRSEIYSSEELKKFKPFIRDIVRINSMESWCGNGHIYGPARTYIHASKRWEYPYIIEQINAHGKRLKIADVGAGRGALSLHLAKRGHDVTVYDMDYNWDNNGDPQTHNRFMRYCEENRVKAKLATGFNLPDNDDSFDVVISTSVIEHVVHKEYMIAEMLRVLKPGGILIMTYDMVASGENTSPDAPRVETLTPSIFEKLLAGIGIHEKPYDDVQIAKSQTEIHSDGIDIHPDVTVGGCVIKKILQ
jgi:SAM-dependent methyltransferase